MYIVQLLTYKTSLQMPCATAGEGECSTQSTIECSCMYSMLLKETKPVSTIS